MADKTTPSAIRAALRREGIAMLPELVSRMLDPEVSTSEFVRGYEVMMRYGLGVADQAAVHVHAEGNILLGVVTMPDLGAWVDPDEVEARTDAGVLAAVEAEEDEG